MVTMKSSDESDPRRFRDQPHYIFKKLNWTEKFVIRAVYFRTWRKLVNSKGLNRNERLYFELYFKEIHTRYYERVVKGPRYVLVSRLTLNFLLSKANENLRAILMGLRPYNLTVFVNAVRSQIELNALVQKFVSDATYHKRHLALNEVRKKPVEGATVTNVVTLVSKLDESILLIPRLMTN